MNKEIRTALTVLEQRIARLKLKGHGEGKYLLQAIPNNEEGQAFLKMFRKHLNRDYFKHNTQGRRDSGTWAHSVSKNFADHFVLYVSPKEGKYFEQVEQSINQKLLMIEERKNRKIESLTQQIDLIKKQLEELKND